MIARVDCGDERPRAVAYACVFGGVASARESKVDIRGNPE